MTSKDIKHYIILLLIVFFSWCNHTSANIIINEIQLNPTEERFIELYNNGSASVDLTDWYIQRKTATGMDFGSLVSKTYFEGKSISPGGYFVISKSSISNSNIIFPSLVLTLSNTIQLKNSKQEIVDKLGYGDATDCGSACAPNPTDGKSIQKKSDGNWFIYSNTRGSSNSVNSNDSFLNDREENYTTNTEENIASLKEDSLPLKINTKIISPKITVAGIPFTLDSITTTNRGKTYMVGRFIWNFGDGNKMEVSRVAPFDYIYDYPGEYSLSLSYFDNSFTNIPEVVNKIIIKVIASDIYINSVGTYVDPYIELENKSNYDMDISNWIINGINHSFTFPKGTTILKGNKLKLSPRITLFNGEDIKYLNITNPNKEIISTYPIKKKTSTQNKYSTVSNISSDLNIGNDKKNNYSEKNSDVIDLNNLEASEGKTKIDLSNSAYPFIGLLIIIGLGIASFLFIKKKKDIEDYVEKEIKPEDMKIIE